MGQGIVTANTIKSHHNKAYMGIKEGCTASATTIYLSESDIIRLFENYDSTEEFYLTITNNVKDIEIIKVTAIDDESGALTIERGQDGTIAQQWYADAALVFRLVADHLDSFVQKTGYREIAINPNGVLSANYRGEKVIQSDTLWWKNISGTDWQLIAGHLDDLLPFVWTQYDISSLGLIGTLNGCYDSDSDKYVLNTYGNEFNDQIESTDGSGTSWSLKNGSFAYGFRRSIYVSSLGLYLAHHNYAFVDGPGFYSSPDAVTWTKRTATTGFSVYGMDYDSTSGVIIAVGDGAAAYMDIWRTTDGITWTGYANPTTWGLNAVHYSSSVGLWCAVGWRIGIITSPDGITWTQRNPDPAGYDDTFEYFLSVASYDGTIIATGNIASGNNYFQYSTDGINWSATQTISGTNPVGGILWCRNKWIVTASTDLWYSEDGLTWTEDDQIGAYAVALTGNRFYNSTYDVVVLFSGNQYVFVGEVN